MDTGELVLRVEVLDVEVLVGDFLPLDLCVAFLPLPCEAAVGGI
jgi:hypothetical protein